MVDEFKLKQAIGNGNNYGIIFFIENDLSSYVKRVLIPSVSSLLPKHDRVLTKLSSEYNYLYIDNSSIRLYSFDMPFIPRSPMYDADLNDVFLIIEKYKQRYRI